MTPPNIKAKKSVRFQYRTSILLIPSLASITDEEYDRLYYNKDDEKRIQMNVVRTISFMRSSPAEPQDDDDEQYCSRGLEHMKSASYVVQRKAERDRVIDAVLNEQDAQWESEQFSAARIAAASAQNSAVAVDYALMMGFSDRAYAMLHNPKPPKEEDGFKALQQQHQQEEKKKEDETTSSMVDVISKVLSMSNLTNLAATPSSSVLPRRLSEIFNNNHATGLKVNVAPMRNCTSMLDLKSMHQQQVKLPPRQQGTLSVLPALPSARQMSVFDMDDEDMLTF